MKINAAGPHTTDDIKAPPPGIGFWSLATLSLWGADIFISYRRSEAREYALELRRQLEAKNYRCFLDDALLPMGQDVERYKQAARRSRMFVLVGTSSVFESIHIPRELEAYCEGHRGWFSKRWMRVLPISVDGALSIMETSTAKTKFQHTAWEPLAGLVCEPESRVALENCKPSKSVIDRIQQSFTLVRSAVMMLLGSAFIGGMILAITLGVILLVIKSANGKVTSARVELSKTNGDLSAARIALTNQQDKYNNLSEQLSTLNGQLTQAKTELTTAQAQIQTAKTNVATAEARATRARNEQQVAEAGAREAQADSLISTGVANLKSAPEVAVNLAFAAHHLTNSLKPAALLDAGIRQNPVWFRLVPEGVKTREKFVLHPSVSISERNSIVANREMTKVLTYQKIPAETSDEKRLALFEVPTGEVLSTLTLKKDQSIITPEPLTSNVFAVATKSAETEDLKLYDLSRDTLMKPLLEVNKAKFFETTGGNWPCYVLKDNGELNLYDGRTKGAAVSEVNVGKWEKAWAVAARPQGGALAIIMPHGVTWVEIGKDNKVKRSAEIKIASTVFLREYRRNSFKIQWSSRPEDFLVANTFGGSFFIWAVHGPNATVQEIYRSKGFTSIAPWFFQTARAGGRFIVGGTPEGNQIEPYVKVFDLEWQGYPSSDIVKVHHSPDNSLIGSRRADSLMFLDSVVISPNGNYVVAAHSFVGTSGTTNSIGMLQSWDISAFDSEGSLRPVSTEFQTGGNPIVRLSYSPDSTRLLAWEPDATTHIFRVRATEPEFLFNQYSRVPEDIEKRFSVRPELLGTNGRVCKVVFSEYDVRYYDLVTGEKTNLQETANGSPILSSSYDEADKSITLVTNKELLQVRAGVVLRREHLLSEALAASVDTNFTVVQTNSALLIFDSASLRQIYSISLGDLKPTWLWIKTYNFRTWVYASTGKEFLAWQLLKEPSTQQLRQLSDFMIPIDSLAESLSSSNHNTLAYQFVGNILIVQIGNEHESSFKFFDLAASKPLDFEQPNNGWPQKTRELYSILITSDQLMLLLDYGGQKGKQLVGTRWSIPTGKLLSQVELKQSGQILYSTVVNSRDLGYLMLQDQVGAVWIRLSDGAQLWRSDKDDLSILPPPLIKNKFGLWVANRNKEYRFVIQSILMGGYTSPLEITNSELPEQIKKIISLLPKARAR